MRKEKKLCLKKVSIHHMLLFITYTKGFVCGKARFNTSHVTLYQWLEKHHEHGTDVSIHHMLLFIIAPVAGALEYSAFQYITCYSLSHTRKTEMEFLRCFNTSHVTLYPMEWVEMPRLERRFNTSHVTLYHGGYMMKRDLVEFQYITCYSLSQACQI